MKSWLYYIILTGIFILNSVIYLILGYNVPLLLAASMVILAQAAYSLPLRLYALMLLCLDYFLWFDQFGPPLLYGIPLLLLSPLLNQILIPETRSILPYIFFTLAFGIQILALEPLVTDIFPSLACTFLPFCGTIIVLKIIGLFPFKRMKSPL